MRKSKNVLSLFAAMMMALSVLLTTGVSAFAQSPKDIWYVGQASETHSWKGSSNFSVDTSTYYQDSRYSITVSFQKHLYLSRLRPTSSLLW